MRYFLAKRQDGPALFVADRIDTLHRALDEAGLAGQFHPSYTRMVPAHYIVDLALVGCPDPDPTYTRFFTPRADRCPRISTRSGGATSARSPMSAPSGCGIDRRAASRSGCRSPAASTAARCFWSLYHSMLRLGLAPARLKAFVLNLGDGPDVDQARAFLDDVGLSLFLEEIDAPADDLDVVRDAARARGLQDARRECATMGLRLCRGIRARYPDWRHLADGDGGDENLKDYPIEENPELTIRSVVDNLMLYQEGWGVGRIKHSLTYSGGLSRSYVRTYAPAARYGFEGFSPYTRPDVIEVAEGIPFASLTHYDVPTLYALKGEIVRRGVKAVTGFEMPVFPKRRFQHGAMPEETMRARLGDTERTYRQAFERMYT